MGYTRARRLGTSRYLHSSSGCMVTQVHPGMWQVSRPDGTIVPGFYTRKTEAYDAIESRPDITDAVGDAGRLRVLERHLTEWSPPRAGYVYKVSEVPEAPAD